MISEAIPPHETRSTGPHISYMHLNYLGMPEDMKVTHLPVDSRMQQGLLVCCSEHILIYTGFSVLQQLIADGLS